MRFSPFIVFAIASASADFASATAERRAKFSCTTVGKSYSLDVDDVGTVTSSSGCGVSMDGSTITYSASKCPGCEIGIICSGCDVDIDGEGDVTFLLPPEDLECSQAEINEANPCVTSSSTEESSMTSTSTSTSTETSTGSTVTESISTETSTGSTVTGTSGGTTRATNICIGAIALVGAAFTML